LKKVLNDAGCYNERAERLEDLTRQQAMEYFAVP
jgi:hypothetical protein